MSIRLWLLPLYFLVISIPLELAFAKDIRYRTTSFLYIHMKLSFYYYIFLIGYHFVSKFW